MCRPSVRSGPWPEGDCPGGAQTGGRAGSQRSPGAVQLSGRLLWPILITLEEPVGQQQIPWTLSLVLLLCDKPLSLSGL